MSDTPVTTLFEELKGLLAQAEGDYAKAREGNQAAGTRVRKVMQNIRNTAKSLRDEIITYRDKSRAARAEKVSAKADAPAKQK